MGPAAFHGKPRVVARQDGDDGLAELLHLGPVVGQHGLQRGIIRIAIVGEETEHRFRPPGGADLHPSYPGYPGRGGEALKLGVGVHRVVVGDRDQADALGPHLGEDFGDRLAAGRIVAVDMQIAEHHAAFSRIFTMPLVPSTSMRSPSLMMPVTPGNR